MPSNAMLSALMRALSKSGPGLAPALRDGPR